MLNLNTNAVPPCGNTGAQNTSGVFLDWLACTFLDGDTIQVIAQELGASLTDDTKWSTGAMGYSEVWSVFGGWIAHNPDRQDMGVHLELSAKALNQFRLETKKTDACIVTWLIALGARFSRLDAAYDVYTKDILDLSLLKEAIETGLCVSRWKTSRQYSMHRLKDGAPIGGTACGGFTFGSRSSRAYLRIYDKRQERITKTGQCDRDYWIRIEMEYKDKNAIAVSSLIQENDSLDWFGANLRYYLDVKAPCQTDANRSRWLTASWWLALTSKVKTRLPIIRKIVTDVVLSAKRWIQHQVAPTLAFLLQIDGGDTRWLRDTMLSGKQSLSKKHKRVLANSTEGI